jgi:5-methylcytosine-specific restriction protein A
MERHYMALSAHARRRVRERDHGVCALCGVTGEWEADHIIPLAEGGTNELSNYRTLCVPCHKAETRALAGRLAQRRADYKAPRLDLK